MSVELKRRNQAFHFEATDGEARVVEIDGAPQIGGEGKGVRPMDLLLMSVGGCSSIDLGLILKKQKQDVTDYTVLVSGERNANDSKAFKAIHLEFVLKGNLDPKKVERAIDLTINKYCSVILSLRENIEITTSYTINGN
jgi:putative redox protein